MARKLFIHMGTAKTGTSSIQLWMARNRDAVRDRGLFYPEIRHGGDQSPDFNHAQHILAFHWGQGWFRYGQDLTGAAWDDFFAQVADWPGNMLISSETFALVAAKHAEALFDLVKSRLPDVEIVPIIYFREHSAFLKSDAFESLRNRPSGGRVFPHVLTPPDYLRDLIAYRKIAENIVGSPQIGESHIRPFDKSQFEGGTLLSEFTGIVGLENWREIGDEPASNVHEDTNAMRHILEAIGGLVFANHRRVKNLAYKVAKGLPDTSGRFRWHVNLQDHFAERFREDSDYLDALFGRRFFVERDAGVADVYAPGETEDRIARGVFETIVGRAPSARHYLAVLEELSVIQTRKAGGGASS